MYPTKAKIVPLVNWIERLSPSLQIAIKALARLNRFGNATHFNQCYKRHVRSLVILSPSVYTCVAYKLNTKKCPSASVQVSRRRHNWHKSDHLPNHLLVQENVWNNRNMHLIFKFSISLFFHFRTKSTFRDSLPNFKLSRTVKSTFFATLFPKFICH